MGTALVGAGQISCVGMSGCSLTDCGEIFANHTKGNASFLTEQEFIRSISHIRM